MLARVCACVCVCGMCIIVVAIVVYIFGGCVCDGANSLEVMKVGYREIVYYKL